MDDVDVFLASLDAYASPSLDDAMTRARAQHATAVTATPRVVTASERNTQANASTHAARKRATRNGGDGDNASATTAATRARDVSDNNNNNNNSNNDNVATTWTCSRCTLVNDARERRCGACALPCPTPLPASAAATAGDHADDAAASAQTCARCTFVNVAGATHCDMCGNALRRAATHSDTTRADDDVGASDNDDDDSPPGDYEGDGDEEDDEDDAEDNAADGDGDNDDDDAHAVMDHRRLVRFLQTLQAASHESLSCAPVPATMQATAQLQPYQLQVVQWMLQRERGASNSSNNSGSNSVDGHDDATAAHEDASTTSTSLPVRAADVRSVCGGIFADYMGLGKTRTVVALCESTRGPRVDRVVCSLVASSATLVVCPTSLLMQWAGEVRQCVRPAPRVLIYHGARKRRCSLFDVAQQYDYVLTSYQTLCHESTGSNNNNNNNNNNSSNSKNNSSTGSDATTMPGKLFMVHWDRVVLDEAHCIRNVRTLQCRACLRLNARARWAVTGTPLQNSVNDLYALVCFLRVPHFATLSWWNAEIVAYLNVNPTHPRPLTALRLLMRALLLRRTAQTRVRGVPIVTLPPQTTTTTRVVLLKDERAFYDDMHARATHKLDALQASSSSSSATTQTTTTTLPRSLGLTFSTALEMLMRCRQACLHPYLVVAALRRLRTTSRGDGSGGDGDAAAALFARNVDVYIQRVLLRRLQAGKNSNSSNSGADATPSFVHALVQALRAQKLEEQECSICLDTLHTPAVLPCAHTFCLVCITHALQLRAHCPLCKHATRPSHVLRVPDELLSSSSSSSNTSTMSIVGDDVDLREYGNWPLQHSAKTRALLRIVAQVPAGERVVVFSAFVSYLQYARHCLQAAGVPCDLYTGNLSVREKATVLRRFAAADDDDDDGDKDNDGVVYGDNGDSATTAAAPPSSRRPRVLLASLTTCGVGVNLACANHCVLMEPTWNPGVEEQAINRVYRIGQTRAVTVHRLVAAGTVEEHVLALCERKRRQLQCCVDDGNDDDDGNHSGGGSSGGAAAAMTSLRLTTRELLQLFARSDATESTHGNDDNDDSNSSSDDGSNSSSSSSDDNDSIEDRYSSSSDDDDSDDSE